MCPSKPDRSPDVTKETRVLKGHPTITREHSPRSRHNSRKSMRLPLHLEMNPDSPALRAEQFCVPHQIHKEP